MAIRCGSCKATHELAAEVRDCYTEARGGILDVREAAAQQDAEIWAENAWLRAAENSGEDDPRERELWAIDPQIGRDFNSRLVANPQTLSGNDDAHECPKCERFCTRPYDHALNCPDWRPLQDPAELARSEAAATRAGASREDLRLRRQRDAQRTEPVPAGFYATKSATGNNDFDFWQVKAGRNAGMRFVNRILGGQPPVWIKRPEQITALKAIEAGGLEECSKRFASELGRCRSCGRSLTDETSREIGMGPECRSK